MTGFRFRSRRGISDAMSRTAAKITQADVARTIRAAKQAGARAVEIRLPGGVFIVRLDGSESELPTISTGQKPPEKRRIML